MANLQSLAEPQPENLPKDDQLASDVLERIQSCLARVNHPIPQRTRLKLLLRTLGRLMEEYSISQAPLIAVEVDSQEGDARAGQSIGRIQRGPRVWNAKITNSTWLKRVTAKFEKATGWPLSDPSVKPQLQGYIRDAVRAVGASDRLNDNNWIRFFKEYCGFVSERDDDEFSAAFNALLQESMRRAEPSKKVRWEKWSDTLAFAMESIFDCRHYSQPSGDAQDWVFYGIGVNATAAAMAFEATCNLIQEWVLHVESGKATYLRGVADRFRRTLQVEKEYELSRARE